MVKVCHHPRGTRPFFHGNEFLLKVVKPFEDRNRFGWTGTTSGRLRSLSPALWSWRRRHVWRQVPRHGFLKRNRPLHVLFFRSDKKTVSITPWKCNSSEPQIWPSYFWGRDSFSKQHFSARSWARWTFQGGLYPYRGIHVSIKAWESQKPERNQSFPKPLRDGSFEAILFLKTTPRPKKRWRPFFFSQAGYCFVSQKNLRT